MYIGCLKLHDKLTAAANGNNVKEIFFNYTVFCKNKSNAIIFMTTTSHTDAQ